MSPFCDLGRQRKSAAQESEETVQYTAKGRYSWAAGSSNTGTTKASLEPCRRKGTQVVLRTPAFDDGTHDLCCDGGEQYPVAEMACRHVVARSFGGAQDRECVGSSRAQAGPVFENLRLTKLRHEFESGTVQALDGRRIGALIEACFFHGGADEQAAVASGH